LRRVIWNMRRSGVKALALLGLAATAPAGEYAVLDTGFVIQAERHEADGELVRLYTGGGAIEIPLRSVVRFEADEPATAAESASPAKLQAPAPAPPPDPKALVEAAARKYGLPPELLHSVAAIESAYDPKAVSPKGAIGVMQLMPATAEKLKADPSDVAQNVDAGARHLRELLERYQYGLYRALAAYNAGAAAVDRYGWIPPYPETQRYVERVAERYRQLSERAGRDPLQRSRQTR
jgi:soluble lytic murein transglycosylase-like protein